MEGHEIRGPIDQVLKLVDPPAKAAKMPFEPRGEQQRSSSPALTLNKPAGQGRIELTGNLDPVTGRRHRAAFPGDVAGRGRAVVMSTHNTALIGTGLCARHPLAQGHIRRSTPRRNRQQTANPARL